MTPSPYHELLQDAIRRQYGCLSVYLVTRNVCRCFEDFGVWEGDIELFSLLHYPPAILCYAWGERIGGEWRPLTVLKLGQVSSPEDAVRITLRRFIDDTPIRP